jgi:hypothetical protein
MQTEITFCWEMHWLEARLVLKVLTEDTNLNASPAPTVSVCGVSPLRYTLLFTR